MRISHSLVLGLLFVGSVASAQGRGRGVGAPGRRGGVQGDPQLVQGADPQRAQRAVRLEIARLVRTQVMPTETQFRQLQALDQRFELDRMKLNTEEQSVRLSLRQLMLDTANVDQGKIGETLDRLIKFPARRAALMEAEQKELSTILSPLQRAKYGAIQEQVRRQIERGRGGMRPAPPDSGRAVPRRPPG